MVVCFNGLTGYQSYARYAADRRLKSNHYALLLCSTKDFVAVNGDQCFVSRYYMFARRDSLKYQLPSRVMTTGELNNDIHIRVINDTIRILS